MYISTTTKLSQQILNTNDPFEAKILSRNIQKYNKDSWNAIAKDACYPGIHAKFEQNPLLKQFLQSTKPTKLAESSYNKFWDTGLALHDKNTLNPGILGKHWLTG